MFVLKNLQLENVVKYTGLPFISTSCTADSTSCTVTDSNIHVKSCKVQMKSLRKLKKKRSY